MFRKSLLAILVVLTVVPAVHAAEHKPGSFGLGWYSFNAPIGGRIWVHPKVGVDLGVGFTSWGDDRKVVLFDLGVPLDIVQTEKVNLFFRPGVQFVTNRRVSGNYPDLAYHTRKGASADVGVEWFVTERFSLGAAYGVEWSQSYTMNGRSDSQTHASGISNIGFHFYF